MKKILTVLLSAVATSIVMPVHAHHSFSAVYDVSQTIVLEGKVAQFLFRNPHSVLHVLVPDESGEMTRWAVEWQGATQLGAGGISAQFLRPGDPVIVKGNPGRNPAEHRIRMVTIKRTTDGFGWGERAGEVVD
jgi:hypothetical protein